MKHFNYIITCVALAFTAPAFSETIRLQGGPMAIDIGYGIKVNESSTLQREILIIQDERLPAKLTGFKVKTAIPDRNWEYLIEYETEITSDISAIQVKFIPFSIWGEKDIPLSATTIADIKVGKWSEDGSWRLSETDAVQHYAMIGFVAQVKLSSGEIIKINPELVVKEAKTFSSDFSTSDLKSDG